MIDTAPHDQQAPEFDHRAGLTPALRQQISVAIEQLSGVETPDDTMLVEIGCGTGQIGVCLAKSVQHYVGLDASPAMLQQFHQRANVALVLADGNKTWPIANHQATIIFSSRAIHWLDITHTVNEALRIARKDRAIFIIGRIAHTPDCWESQLRRQCHHLLKEHDLTPKNGEQHLKKLLDAFRNRKSEVLPTCIVQHWQQQRSVQQALHDWANKPGLAGASPTPNLKQKILTQLEHWAIDTFGTAMPTQTQRCYTLHGIRLFA